MNECRKSLKRLERRYEHRRSIHGLKTTIEEYDEERIQYSVGRNDQELEEVQRW